MHSREKKIAAELDELPLPYRFDVKAFPTIKLLPLRALIERVGIPLYSAAEPGKPKK
jgi:hypothetical protein